MPPKKRKRPISAFPLVRTLTHSSRGVFASCPQKFHYEYQQRLAPNRLSMPLEIGAVFHDEIDIFYRALRDDGEFGEQGIFDAQERITEHFSKLRAGVGTTVLQPYDYDKIGIMEAICAGMVAGYVRKYEDKDHKQYKVIEPEQEFEIPIPTTDGWSTRGKIDLVLKVRGKKQYRIMEHKTAAQISVGYVSRIALDKQTLRYIWAARLLSGLPIKKIVYNVIKKPGIRQGKKETFDAFLKRVEDEYEDETKYFYREILTPTEEQIASIPSDDKKFVKLIERAQKTGYYPLNTNHCFDFNSTCPFMRLCIEGQSVDTLSDYRVKARTHEELSK